MMRLDALRVAPDPNAEVVIRPRGAPWTPAALVARAHALAPPPLEGPVGATVRALAYTDSADQLAATLGAWHVGDAVLLLDPAQPLDRQVARATALGASSLGTDAGHFVMPPADVVDASGWALVLPRADTPEAPPSTVYTADALRVLLARSRGAPGDRPLRRAMLRPPRSAATLLDTLAPLFGGGEADGATILACDLEWPSARLDLLAAAEAEAVVGHPEALFGLATAALDRAPTDRPDLRSILCTDATPTPALAARLRSAFPHARLRSRYGHGPLCPFVARTEADPDEAAAPQFFSPYAGVEFAVLTPDGHPCPTGRSGVLHLRGEGLAVSTVPGDAWRSTGDRCVDDGGGRLRVLGRVDGEVQIAGRPVRAGRVAALLRRGPGVEHVEVLPVTDPWGTHRLVAVVASSIPPAALSAELGRYARAVLDGPERPSRIVCLPEWPRGPLGTPDHALLFSLAEHALAGLDTPLPGASA